MQAKEAVNRATGLERQLEGKTQELTTLLTKLRDLEAREELRGKLEAEKAAAETKLKVQEQKVTELEMRLEELQRNPPKNNPLYDSDDVGLLVVENESLKRKVKLLEGKLSDQPSAEKIAQKIESKDFEIRTMKTKIEKADKEIVGLSGGLAEKSRWP